MGAVALVALSYIALNEAARRGWLHDQATAVVRVVQSFLLPSTVIAADVPMTLTIASALALCVVQHAQMLSRWADTGWVGKAFAVRRGALLAALPVIAVLTAVATRDGPTVMWMLLVPALGWGMARTFDPA